MNIKTIQIPSLPGIEDFYSKYWNKKPFFVKNALPQDILDDLITADELAGLSLEEDVRSRIIYSMSWKCEHGPFEEDKFSTLGEEGWSLLVQDVEKNHPPTKKIIDAFTFSPCWLIDDVMVSYSPPGGGVGPHLDSYHVFLIQGTGRRQWKVGQQKVMHEKYIPGLDIKVLADDFDGEVIEVEEGDVLYIPPYFAHSGKTIEESLTFSLGFLGPTISELLGEYALFIEEQDMINQRYDGDQLDAGSAGNKISAKEVENFRESLKSALNSDQFEKWLKDYFKKDD
ncbi:MAG: cupin domain-containing protein [Emcibacteraceae bacterium]